MHLIVHKSYTTTTTAAATIVPLECPVLLLLLAPKLFFLVVIACITHDCTMLATIGEFHVNTIYSCRPLTPASGGGGGGGPHTQTLERVVVLQLNI